jgi:AcrR family transcriptional regulator
VPGEQQGDATVAAGSAAPRRRVGRPARLDRAAIARASAEFSLDQVTMRSVADRLGVSVPSLYHYVRGRDDLLRLAAEQSASRISVPEDRGQHWSEWLYQWADHARSSFAAQPALLEQFMHAAFGLDRMVDHLDAAIGVLVKQGFSAGEAQDAYNVVTECAVGAAVAEIRKREMAEAGHPLEKDYETVLGARGADELIHLRAALAQSSQARESFEHQIATVLAGVAVRRGEAWQPVVARILPAEEG